MGAAHGELLLAVIHEGVPMADLPGLDGPFGLGGAVGIHRTHQRRGGAHGLVHIGAAAVQGSQIFLPGSQLLRRLLRQGFQVLQRGQRIILADQLQAFLPAIIQVFGPDGAGGLHRFPVAAHQQGHHGLLAGADPGKQVFQHRVAGLAGHDGDVFHIRIRLQSSDAHFHHQAAHLILQVVAAGADDLRRAAARLMQDGAHVLDAAAGRAHDTEGPPVGDGGKHQGHAVDVGHAAVRPHTE